VFATIAMLCLVCAAAPGAVGSAVAAEPAPQAQVRLLDEYVVLHGLQFEGTPVGGLSSIDYDRETDQFGFVSDDWSDFAPARYYTAEISLDEFGVHGVEFTDVQSFRRPDGMTYPTIDEWRSAQHDVSPAQRNVLGTVDPEELRFDPWSGDVAWTSEGQRNVPAQGSPDEVEQGTVLLDPALRISESDGDYLREVPTAANEKMTMGESGPRVNETFEGLTYAAGGTLLVSALEGPLEQDPPPATAQRGSYSRITVHSRSGEPLAQYAYPVEPVFAAPSPPSAFHANGISSLVAYDERNPNRFLALERAFAVGVGAKGRVFEFTTVGASNVLDQHSLSDAPFQPVRKKLLFDLDDIGVSHTDNVEGITWGPRLPTGERTILIISDNNFSPNQQTQIIAVAVS
jgi:hypothetical protein